jgi:hypothetical protein
LFHPESEAQPKPVAAKLSEQAAVDTLREAQVIFAPEQPSLF